MPKLIEPLERRCFLSASAIDGGPLIDNPDFRPPNEGQTHAVQVKVDQAVASFRRGNAQAFAGQIRAFVNQVEAFERAGISDPEIQPPPIDTGISSF